MTAGASAPLAGRVIVVTRPRAQSEAMCEAIARRGGEALCFPLLEISAPDDPAPLLRVADRLEQYDLAFFVSPNAVEHALRPILARRAWPPGLKVATVGRGSERALAAFGFRDVIAPDAGFDSESVLALAEFQAERVRGRRILIFRGDGGRDLLGDTLREYGAEVEYVACYHRGSPASDPVVLLDAHAAGRLSALTLTSSEGVRNLAALLGTAGIAALRAVPVFASHPRIAAHAREAGFVAVHETAPGDDGLLAALDAYFLPALG